MILTPKDRAELARASEGIVTDWLKAEGFDPNKSEKPNESNLWEIVFKRSQGDQMLAFNAVRPKGRPIVGLVVQINIEPAQVAMMGTWSPERRRRLTQAIRAVAFQGGNVGFSPRYQGDVLLGWALDVQVWDDGLSMHTLHDAYLRLLSKHLEIVDQCAMELEGFRSSGSGGGLPGYY